MRQITFTIVLLFIATCSVQAGFPGTYDTVETKWPNGNLKERWVLKIYNDTTIDSEKDGLYESWYESGGIQVKGFYVEDTEAGWWTKWHESGSIMEEGNMAFGKKTGAWINWDENGTRVEETCYLAGLKHGRHIVWDPNYGPYTIRDEYFRGGKLHGLCSRPNETSFYVDGRLIIAFLEEGKRLHSCAEPGKAYNDNLDLWIEWNLGCTVISIGKYDDDGKYGKWLIWTALGEETVFYPEKKH